MKAMFLAANRIAATDGDSLLAYQLFQIAKRLKSGQLMLLKVCYGIAQAGNAPRQFLDNFLWLSDVAGRLGHKLTALMDQDARVLVDCGLLSPITGIGGVNEKNGRLTDLGVRFCQNVESYDQTMMH